MIKGFFIVLIVFFSVLAQGAADNLGKCITDTLKMYPPDVFGKMSYDKDQKILIETRPSGLKILHAPANSFVYQDKDADVICDPKLAYFYEDSEGAEVMVGLYDFLTTALVLNSINPRLQAVEKKTLQVAKGMGMQNGKVPPPVPDSCIKEPRIRKYFYDEYCNKSYSSNLAELQNLCSGQPPKTPPDNVPNIKYSKPEEKFTRACLEKVYADTEKYAYNSKNKYLTEEIEGAQWVYVRGGATYSYFENGKRAYPICIPKSRNSERTISKNLIKRLQKKTQNYSAVQRRNFFAEAITPCKKANLGVEFEDYLTEQLNGKAPRTPRGSEIVK